MCMYITICSLEEMHHHLRVGHDRGGRVAVPGLHGCALLLRPRPGRLHHAVHVDQRRPRAGGQHCAGQRRRLPHRRLPHHGVGLHGECVCLFYAVFVFKNLFIRESSVGNGK